MCGNILQISGLRSTWTPSDDHFNYYLKIVKGRDDVTKLICEIMGFIGKSRKNDEKCPLVKNQPIESF